MVPVALSSVVVATGARAVGTVSPWASVSAAVTRPAAVGPGALFVALGADAARTRRAVAGGAAAVLGRDYAAGCRVPQLLVPSVTDALADLARAYRSQFDVPVVVIAGAERSRTTEAVLAALAPSAAVHVIRGGDVVPLALGLLRLGAEHDAVVVEVEADGPGVAARASRFLRPTVAVATSAEGAAPAAGPAEIAAGLDARGLLVANADGGPAGVAPGGRVVQFGRAYDAELRVEPSGGAGTFAINGVPVAAPTGGQADRSAVAAACAVLAELGVPVQDTIDRLDKARPRSQAASVGPVGFEPTTSRV